MPFPPQRCPEPVPHSAVLCQNPAMAKGWAVTSPWGPSSASNATRAMPFRGPQKLSVSLYLGHWPSGMSLHQPVWVSDSQDGDLARRDGEMGRGRPEGRFLSLRDTASHQRSPRHASALLSLRRRMALSGRVTLWSHWACEYREGKELERVICDERTTV